MPGDLHLGMESIEISSIHVNMSIDMVLCMSCLGNHIFKGIIPCYIEKILYLSRYVGPKDFTVFPLNSHWCSLSFGIRALLSICTSLHFEQLWMFMIYMVAYLSLQGNGQTAAHRLSFIPLFPTR